MSNNLKSEEVLTNSSSSIIYKGSVKIEMIRGNKVIKTITQHNQGQLSLFSFISQCLAGTFKDSLRPKILQAYTKANNEYTKRTSTPILYRSCRAIGDGKTVYKFLIPANAILGTGAINHFRLFSTDNVLKVDELDSCSAYIDYKETDIVPDSKTNFLITWTLQVTNNTQGDN